MIDKTKENVKSMLKAVSPLDGRYHQTTATLSDYFSEYALIKYRTHH
jgi:adenylosuccinate lyase